MGGVGGRPSQLPARGDRNGWNNYRNNRATNVRNWSQNNYNYNRIVNRPGGWWGGGYGHGFAHGWAASNRWHGWGGYWGWHGHSPGCWWGAATVVGLTSFWAGTLFASSTTTPAYYDYGDTVYVDNSQIYMNGQPIATEEQYASQATQIASVSVPEPPAVSETGAESPADDAAMEEYAKNWMPLGVFGVARAKDDSDPSHFLQLAVSKEGYIAGTCYNLINDQTLPVTGSVDKTSQRAAWRFADNPDVVMETGIFNLTQDTAPALVHFGKDKTETRLLVRMEKPKEEASTQ